MSFKEMFFPSKPPTEQNKAEQEKPAKYIVMDYRTLKLHGVFDNRQELMRCDEAHIGDEVFIVRDENDIAHIQEISGSSDKPGEEIKKYLEEKGYEVSHMPSNSNR